MKHALSLLATVILAGCSLFHSPPANAGTLLVGWVNPVTNTDTTPIPATQGEPEALQTWLIEWGTCAAGGTFGTLINSVTRTRATGGPALTQATVNVPGGEKCVRVFVSNMAGVKSDASNVAAREVPYAKPGPATNVTAVLQGS